VHAVVSSRYQSQRDGREDLGSEIIPPKHRIEAEREGSGLAKIKAEREREAIRQAPDKREKARGGEGAHNPPGFWHADATSAMQ